MAMSEDLSEKLVKAASEGHLDDLKVLLSPNPTEVLADAGLTLEDLALKAASSKHLQVLHHILSLGANAKDWSLYETVLDSHSQDLYEIVLPFGFDLNLDTDNLVGGPLRWAIQASNLSLAKYLIKRGADVNMDVQTRKYTPLAKAALKNNVEMMQLLTESGAEVDRSGAVIVAAREGNLEALTWLVEKAGADVNIMDGTIFFMTTARKQTALHAAVLNGHENVVRYLLENGADISARDSDGKTALDVAVDLDQQNMISLLKGK